jgi:hypothetical protein
VSPVAEESKSQLAGGGLTLLPCLDSEEMAARCREDLNIPRGVAAALGRSAVEAVWKGHYATTRHEKVDWRPLVNAARTGKQSIKPDAPLPTREHRPFPTTNVEVTNETTVRAAKRLVEAGLRPLALNFAKRCSARRRVPWRGTRPRGSSLPVQRLVSHPRRRPLV